MLVERMILDAFSACLFACRNCAHCSARAALRLAHLPRLPLWPTRGYRLAPLRRSPRRPMPTRASSFHITHRVFETQTTWTSAGRRERVLYSRMYIVLYLVPRVIQIEPLGARQPSGVAELVGVGLAVAGRRLQQQRARVSCGLSRECAGLAAELNAWRNCALESCEGGGAAYVRIREQGTGQRSVAGGAATGVAVVATRRHEYDRRNREGQRFRHRRRPLCERVLVRCPEEQPRGRANEERPHLRAHCCTWWREHRNGSLWLCC